MAASGRADGLLAFFCARSIFQPFCTVQSQQRLSSAEAGCALGTEPAFSKRTRGCRGCSEERERKLTSRWVCPSQVSCGDFPPVFEA